MTTFHSAQGGRDPAVEWILRGAVFVLLLAVTMTPIVFLFYATFRTGSPGASGVTLTLRNWLEVYGTFTYWKSFLNTLWLSAAVAAGSVLIGTVLAWIVARTNAPGRDRFGPLLVVPLMASTLVTALAWVALAAPNAGFINALSAQLFGVARIVNIYSFTGIVFILVFHYAAFAFISIYAALRSVDAALEEACYILGATPFRTSLNMTFPLIWPSLASTFLLIFIFTAENFAVPTLLGSQINFDNLMYQIYRAMTLEPTKPNLGATAGTMLLSIAIAGTFWQRRIIARAGRYATIGGKGGNQRITDLGRWRPVATAVLVIYLLLAVVIPYCALVFGSFLKFVTPRFRLSLCTLDNYGQLFGSSYLTALFNSLLLAGLGALVATLVYVFVAHLINRSGGWVGRVVEYAVMIPTVTPSLVLGIGLLWAYVWLPIPVYGTLWILFIGYFTRFAGQGVRQSRSALVQISSELPEAARIAGATPFQTFRDITVPLLRRSIMSIWTLMFIFFFMEVSLTVVLYTPDTITLPILLWLRMSSGFLTQAYALATVEATLIFAFVFIADRFFGILRASLPR
jgi:iron(III) transport system permease protein